MTEVKKYWKTLAIIFIVLFVAETLFIGWGMFLVSQEEAKVNECYYNVCDGYPEAYLEGDVCFCYDYDNLGSYVIAKTEVMK